MLLIISEIILISLLISVIVWIIWLVKSYKAKNARLLKILIIVPLVVLLISIIVIITEAFNYPEEWNDKILGQKRIEIHKQLGAPIVGELWDVKADIWSTHNFYSWHRLDVIYEVTPKTWATK